jgi:hypothetical protein
MKVEACRKIQAGIVATVFVLAALAFSGVAFALEIGGYDYGVAGDVLSLYNISDYQYDQHGRVTSFSYSAPDGAHGTGSISYSDESLDANGDPVSSTGTIHGISSIEGQSGTVTKVGSTADGGGSGGSISHEAQAALADMAAVQEAAAAKQVQEQAMRKANNQALRDQRRSVERMFFKRAMNVFGAKPATGQAMADAGGAKLSGMSSGEWYSNVSVWADGSITPFGSWASGAQNNGTDYVAMLGMELVPTDMFMLGLGVGYGHTDIFYHVGAGAKQHDNSLIVNPYLAVSFTDWLMLAVQGGLTFGSSQLNGNFATGTGSRYADFMTSSIGAALIPSYAFDRLVLSGQFGYSYSYKDYHSNSFQDAKQGLLNAGAGLAYHFDKCAPYINAMYSYNTIAEDGYQPSDMVGMVGLALTPTQNFQADFSVSNTFFRSEEYNTSFDLTLRYTF